MKSKVMRRAHELAKKMIGDWYARLSLALRQAWREVRGMLNEIKAQVNNGINGAIKEMEPFKAQSKERYEQLIGIIEEIRNRANNKLNQFDEVQLKAMGITSAKGFVNYFARSSDMVDCKEGKQLAALIIRNV